MTVNNSEDLVAQATAALEGVTPGPWKADGEPWNQIVWSGAENRVCFMAHSNGLNDDRDVATARFIAFARQWVPEAAARLSALTAENHESVMQALASMGQAQEAYEAQLAAEAENATLRDRLARMEGAVANLPAVYAHQINTGVREVYDPLQRFFTLESVLSALTDGGSNG